jgi:predicted exporter
MKPNSITAEQRLRHNWQGIEDGMYLVVTDTSFKGVVEKTENILQPVIDTLIQKNHIKKTVLFTLLFPSENSQKKNRKRWYATFTADRISLMIQAANTITKKYGFESSQFSSYFSKIAFIDSLHFLKKENFPRSITEGLLKNYVCTDDSLWYTNVPVIQATDTSWSHIEKLAKQNNILPINDAALGLRVVDIIKTGFFKCLILIPLVIVCILCITLGNVKHAFLVLIPTFMAMLMTLGCMSFFNIPVSIISLMIFAFIFGLGIDYTILMFYMSKKALLEGQPYIYHGAASVTIASSTTLTGLGILICASHPVLSSVGKTGVIGILSSYICAIVFVPLLVRFPWNRIKR